MALVDLKYTAAEQKEEAKEGSVMGSNMPSYPWGLCLDLDDETLKKLGIDKLPEVGDEYHILAVGKVTRISSSADEKEKENRLTIQLMMMQMEHEAQVEEKGEKETPQSEMKEKQTSTLLTNAMR